MSFITRDVRRIAPVLLASMLLVALLGGCAPESSEPATPPVQTETPVQPPAEAATPPVQEEESLYTPDYQPVGDEIATMETTKGTIVIELYGKDAPIHVGNFVELARDGFYDKTKFHRYEPGFVVQGGDPQTLELSSDEVIEAVQTGSVPLGIGGPGYVIRGEFDPAVNPNKHVEGALGMARSQSPDSAGSQFYFAIEALPQLDAQYTVFGKITKGLDVMKELRVGDEIKSVKISGGRN